MKRIKEFGIGGEGKQEKGASIVCFGEFRNLRKDKELDYFYSKSSKFAVFQDEGSEDEASCSFPSLVLVSVSSLALDCGELRRFGLRRAPSSILVEREGPKVSGSSLSVSSLSFCHRCFQSN
ncbi:hypothetical protein KFK09_026610 [Dendrobium nobile]|uniref:Uncharacterized protein n=1 Tax=Dendrobium nobile TaxID=94219 RepID=A0A8T3A8B4_DENNO|nr:hypothetical protein KFK09_026610 [Dendrobium nobile]